MSKKYNVIVNVNLEYEVTANSVDEANEIVANLELPKEYVEDSFEYVKTIDSDWNEY